MSAAMTASYAAALLFVPLMAGLAGTAYTTGLKSNWAPTEYASLGRRAFHVGAAVAIAAYVATFPTTLTTIPDAWRYEAWLTAQAMLGGLLTPTAIFYWERMTHPKRVRRQRNRGGK